MRKSSSDLTGYSDNRVGKRDRTMINERVRGSAVRGKSNSGTWYAILLGAVIAVGYCVWYVYA